MRQSKLATPPSLQGNHALLLMQQILGSSRGWVVFTSLLLLIGLGWFADALHDLIGLLPWLWGAPIDTQSLIDPQHLIGLCLFPLLLAKVWWRARQAGANVNVVVASKSPTQVRALVLFLSPWNASAEQRAALEGGGLDIRESAVRCLLGSWRMPAEAIHYHLRSLREVVLVPSGGEQGTYRQVQPFQQLMLRLLPGHPIRIQAIGEHVPEYGQGVDFEDIEQLVRATEDAYQHLVRQGYRDGQVLIDVTGGQKTTSIAGAAVALATDRCVQYVSTRDYQVKVFDISYELHPEG